MRSEEFLKVLAVLEESTYCVGLLVPGEQSKYDEALMLLKRGHDEAWLAEQNPKPATTLTREDLERIIAIKVASVGSGQLGDLIYCWFPEDTGSPEEASQ